MNLPQLQMRRWNLDSLPDGDPRVRRARPSDVPALAQVLTLAFDEEWSEERVLDELLEDPDVPVTFVAVHVGQIVATASLQHKAGFPDAGWVHWVAVAPECRGLKLGRAVTLAVLHAARNKGKTQSGLTTDDFRLPAIRTYLGLGFEPDPCHPSHPERWAEIVKKLNQ
jgi:mycothiol synthase